VPTRRGGASCRAARARRRIALPDRGRQSLDEFSQRPGRSFIAALFTTRRELISAMVSMGSRPLARSVLPVSTMSTIRSASPSTGASSIAP
jgi:hypothetical protein